MLRPSIFTPDDNLPAVLFRPAFFVTGAMLQATIREMIGNDPQGRLTEGAIVSRAHEILLMGGGAMFGSMIHGAPTDTPEAELSLAYSRILFPDFFPAATPDELAGFKKLIRAHHKPAPAPSLELNPTDAPPAAAPAAEEELAWDDPRQVRTITSDDAIVAAAKEKRRKSKK